MTEAMPFVTVVLPIRNESRFIARSLGAILAQDYPSTRMEVIIADGMSTDSTRACIANAVAEAPGVAVTLLDNPGRIVATGLNVALSRARGDVIVRIDGHTVIAPDYVRQCVAALERSGADNVGGRMEAVSETAFGRAVAIATSSPFGVGGARFHYSTREEWVDTVYLGAWRRTAFERIGLFDEELTRNQDDEFNYRLLDRGGRILLSPLITSRYYARSSPSALWKQYFQYGFWKVRVIQKHPRQARLRQLVPALFAAALLASFCAAPFSSVGRWCLFASSASYLGANVVASLVAARRGEYRLLPFLPATFAILHLAYGLGFLVGMIHYRSYWGRAEVWTPLSTGPVGTR